MSTSHQLEVLEGTGANEYIPLIVERLKQIKPAKVILFGSYAQGTALAESDLDILVVTDSEEIPQNYHQKEQVYLEVARLLRDIRGQIPLDLIVHTRAMYARFMELNSHFARELSQKGILLYESGKRSVSPPGGRTTGLNVPSPTG